MYQLGSAILKPFGLKADPTRVLSRKETRQRLYQERKAEAEIQRQLAEFDIHINRLAHNYSKLLYSDKELESGWGKGSPSRSSLVNAVKEMQEFEDWILRCHVGNGSYEEMHWYHKQLQCTCPSTVIYTCEVCPHYRMR